MDRNRKYMQVGATLLGASMLALAFPAHSVGQCCQTPCGSTAAPTPNVAGHPTQARAQRSCPAAKSWRQHFKPTDPRAGKILDLAEHALVKMSEFYEKLTFGEHSTKWSSWCSGKPKTGTSPPCIPKCCQKPGTNMKPTPDANTKGSG